MKRSRMAKAGKKHVHDWKVVRYTDKIGGGISNATFACPCGAYKEVDMQPVGRIRKSWE